MNGKYEFHNKQGAYFVSFATGYWPDVFTRKVVREITKKTKQFWKLMYGDQ